ncbi:MAG: rSAM/selenodomain-associated transferase 2 [Myxococcota bacterium]
MVIPALDEATTIEEVVESALGDEVEVIVVDGGSQDGTPERATRAGARVVSSQRGRARQLQVGFEASKGDVVLFLHADTRLPPGWERAVAVALGDASYVGGAFRLTFEEQDVRIRRLEWLARLRIAATGFPYGDQALFVRRSVLADIGGVPDVPVMEDVDLVAAMKRRGKLAMLSLPAVTSARRYLDHGVVRVSILHFFAMMGWALGVPRERIARWLGR